MDTKVCKKCGIEYPATTEFFHIQKVNRLKTKCKECCNEISRQYKNEHKEKISEYRKEYYKNNREKEIDYEKKYNKENSEYISLRRKQYYENHKEHISEVRKIYYKNNKEELNYYSSEYYKKHRLEIRERHKKYEVEWRIKNKEYCSLVSKTYRIKHIDHLKEKRKEYVLHNKDRLNLLGQRYRARVRNLPSTLTVEQWLSCKEYFNDCCAYCGVYEKLSQDHLIPVVKGGGFSVDNIIPACHRCNSSKGAKDIWDWFSKQTYFSEEREDKIINYLDIQINENIKNKE